MRYFQASVGPETRLVAHDGTDAFDLSSARRHLTDFTALARTADGTDRGIDAVAERLLESADPVDLDTFSNPRLPVVADEVWAAGVTYEISEEARKAESGMPEMYLDVYGADRPEIFFKATPSRTVGPGEDVGIREDSAWDVPEPELGVVLYDGDVVGYTVGNDMSSRGIEGQNPLYLPQAKVYDRCCAIGPCVVSPETVGDPHDLTMSMTISRDDETVFDGSTTTAAMARTCEELVSYFTRHNAVPETAVLLTGTSLVPDDAFTLRAGDVVRIGIEHIGSLENEVTVV